MERRKRNAKEIFYSDFIVFFQKYQQLPVVRYIQLQFFPITTEGRREGSDPETLFLEVLGFILFKISGTKTTQETQLSFYSNLVTRNIPIGTVQFSWVNLCSKWSFGTEKLGRYTQVCYNLACYSQVGYDRFSL